MKYEALKARLRTVGYFATDEDAKEAADAIEALEVALSRTADELRECMSALEPFAEASCHLRPSHADDMTTLDGFTVAQFREANRLFWKARTQ